MVQNHFQRNRRFNNPKVNPFGFHFFLPPLMTQRSPHTRKHTHTRWSNWRLPLCCLITSLQFVEGVSNELSRRLLQLEIRSQDSPFIADVLVVERVRWVKTFAQHATLGVLEVAYKKEIR